MQIALQINMYSSGRKKLAFPIPSVLILLYKMQVPEGLSWRHTPIIQATGAEEVGEHQV